MVGCDKINLFPKSPNLSFSLSTWFFSYHRHNNSHPDGVALAGSPKLLQDSPEGSTPQRGRATAQWGDYDCCDKFYTRKLGKNIQCYMYSINECICQFQLIDCDFCILL